VAVASAGGTTTKIISFHRKDVSHVDSDKHTLTASGKLCKIRLLYGQLTAGTGSPWRFLVKSSDAQSAAAADDDDDD